MSNYAANFTIVTRASLPPYSYWENTNSETNIDTICKNVMVCYGVIGVCILLQNGHRRHVWEKRVGQWYDTTMLMVKCR